MLIKTTKSAILNSKASITYKSIQLNLYMLSIHYEKHSHNNLDKFSTKNEKYVRNKIKILGSKFLL